MSVGERIRIARKQLGLTMKQFAEPLGLSESAISRIETGTANASTAVLKLMSSVYGIDYFWLTEGSGGMFVDSTDALIDELASEKHWDSDTVDIMKDLFALPKDKFDLVMQLIRSMSNKNTN